MIGIKTVLFSLSVVVLVSGYQGDRDQDAYLDTLLKRLLLDLEEKDHRVDDSTAKRYAQVEIADEVGTSYWEFFGKRMYSWVICKITIRTLVVESKAKGTYDEFVAALKASGEPRFAIYQVPDDEWGLEGDNTVVIYWLPDGTKAKAKALYSSVKDRLLWVFTAYKAYLNITDKNASIKDLILDKLA